MESNVFVSVILPSCLAVIMFGMGSTLVVSDFRSVFAMPKALVVGVLGQMLLLPLTGFLFIYLFELNPTDSVGLMILVACAGGPMSNLIVYLIKADVALSVTLTAISCCLTIFTIPLIVNMALTKFMNADQEASLPIGSTNLTLFIITVLPLILGMLLRHRNPNLASKIESPLNQVSTTFFIFIVIAIILKERASLSEVFSTVGPAAYTLNIFMMFLGFTVSRWFRLNMDQSKTISIEIGLQNSATGIFIATGLLLNPKFAVIPAVYAICMMINVAIMAGFLRWKIKYSRLPESVQH